MLPISTNTQAQLSKQFQQGTLAHAILIQGIAGTAKQALAQWLLDLLICQAPVNVETSSGTIKQGCGRCKTCLLNKSGSYPDHLAYSADNKTLGIDDIRRGNSFLETKPHIGSVKTLFIPNAQNMTVASANALLKTLEEPNKNSYIVLITEGVDDLLPTIISRCAVYSIRPSVGNALLAELNLPQDKALSTINSFDSDDIDKAFVNLSQLPELTDQETLKRFKEFKSCLISFLVEGQEEEQLLMLVNSSLHSLRWMEKITGNLIRHYYLANHKKSMAGNLNEKISIQALNQIFQAIINSNKLIKSYAQANPQYVGVQLIMTINKIVRPIG